MLHRQSFTWLGISPAFALPPSSTAPAGGTLRQATSEWSALLPQDAYRVLFEEGTEHAGASPLNDGPQPTGQRYCNNVLSLRFVARADSLPPLRG